MHRIAEWFISLFRLAWSAIRAHAKAIGILAAIGASGTFVKWIADIRKSWHEGNLAKEQLRLLLKQQADEERLPALVKEMEEVIASYRKEANVSCHLMLTDEFFLARMKEKDRSLIRRGIAEIEEKQQKINALSRFR